METETLGLPVISLFTGAGGLDLAVERCAKGQDSGQGLLEVKIATDYSDDALKTYRANFPDVPTVCRDIRRIPTAELLEVGGIRREEAALVVGGPPCTPFSKSGYWLEEKRNGADPNASLLDDYVRVVAEARPEAFILENVQGLTYRTHREQFERLKQQLRSLGYRPVSKVLNAADYGVPQMRRRVFVVGRRDGRAFQFPEPTHGGVSEREDSSHPNREPFVTAEEAIGDLLPGEPEEGELVEGRWGEAAATIPPGQNYLWHTKRYDGQDLFKWRSRYWTFLLRLEPGRPATTIQAQPGPWVGPFHWENLPNGAGEQRARRLRVPELLRLMTFPDDMRLVGDRRGIQQQIGNAVPLKLARVLVAGLLQQLGHLEGCEAPSGQLSLV